MMNGGQQSMDKTQLYPLRFEPIYQYRLWGGRRLSGLLSTPLPGDGPIGEAWVLSDRIDHQNTVTNGLLKGQALGQVMAQFPEQMMSKFSSRFHSFPLLLKFLDACEILSVQVHPNDAHPELIPTGGTAKTEAWVGIEAEKESHIYAGLRSGTTSGSLLMTVPLRTSLCALPRNRETQYSSLREQFTLWATMSWFSRFNKTAM
jgi:mannose-6-phosphate isomerase